MKTGNNGPEVEAAASFANHVQSVAFQLSLSKAMIAELEVIRDWGYPKPDFTNNKADQARFDVYQKYSVKFPRVMRHFMTHRPALERRGLIYRRPAQTAGDRTWLLSRPGELICELLVEAGLLAPGKKTRKAS